MLTFLKSLNNNIILAKDNLGSEVVAFGTGLGFKKKIGEHIDEAKVTKVFSAKDENHSMFMMDNLPAELIEISLEIIEMAEAFLGRKLNKSLIFSLADHINFALERNRRAVIDENPLQWEIPHLYYQEYRLAEEAVNLINGKFAVDLPQSEASFIALHLVNGQQGSTSMHEVMQLTKITKDIVKIIQTFFLVQLDKTTINYSRFTTHVRYFLMRQTRKEPNPMPMDTEVKLTIIKHYNKSYECSLAIILFLKKEYGWAISEDEIVYLIVHIERLLQENKRCVTS